MKHIKKYKKTIIDNSKKLDKTISGEYFRQQFNKIFNYKTFDFIKNNIIKAEVEINKNSALSDYAKMVKNESLTELNGIFSVVLAFLWNIANDKQGIKEYYRGLYQHIYNSELELLIKDQKPSFFENYNYNKLKIKSNISFNKALATFKHNIKGKLSFQGTEDLGGWGDCVETSIKNFIKVLIFNQSTNTFDLEKLKSLGAKVDSDIFIFFKKFNKDSDHSSNSEADFNGEILDVRKSWARIMNGIPNVTYNRGMYEIKPGKSIDGLKNNIEAVLEDLFETKTFRDLEEKVPGLKITKITDVDIKVEYDGNLYQWISAQNDEHMDFKLLISKNNFNIKKELKKISSNLSDFQHKILHFHSKKHLIEEQKRTYSFEFIYDIYKYFYFFNISNDSLLF